jgi:hypothetical protein
MKHNKDGVHVLSTWDIIKNYCYNKIVFGIKEPVGNNSIPPAPDDDLVSHLAVILDDRVQEIMRAEQRFTSLLLSQPKFVEFNPNTDEYPGIGWEYLDGSFIEPTQEG